ncbi:phosphoglucosamine mutase [Candidatus Woesearchaeota archaeon]|nr:phosphoglucosamine mutase [Candidatus Woesearchaeota archaeon]
MVKQLFGTDGVRGKANRFPMTPEIALKLGQAAAKVLLKQKNKDGEKCKVIIGKDTRISGYVFETALTSGFCSMGVDVYLVGPLPTPAIAHLTKSFAADAGIMITASHNPASDNGIKFFSSDGYKLSDALEQEIEQLVIHNHLSTDHVAPENLGKAYRIDHAKGRYIEFAKSTIKDFPKRKLKIVLDCANGASYSVAPMMLKELGFEVIVINDAPNGLNINDHCGAMHPEQIQKKVMEVKADIGFAFDGDADRVVVIDQKSNVVDGDYILALCAQQMLVENTLKHKTVVVTEYSNLALDNYLASIGGKVVRTQNGDRYVIEVMKNKGYNFGGEASGHIIFGDYNTTGDGIVSALKIVEILSKTNKKMSELVDNFKKYPQVLINIQVQEKKPLGTLPKFTSKLKEYEQLLGTEGRILIRYSGTEMICRIMVEGKQQDQVKMIAEDLAGFIKQEVGVNL